MRCWDRTMTETKGLEEFLDEATNSLEFLEYEPDDEASVELDLRHEVVLCEPLAAVLARQRMVASRGF